MGSVIGWDIGGAHLKAARAEGGRIIDGLQLPCNPHYGLTHLEQAIAQAAERLGPADRHAVTMTAELSDAFETRAAGVAIIAAIFMRKVESNVAFFAGEKGFVPYSSARENASAIASANWRASAELVARRLDHALFVDMGSTTTDLVPIEGGAVTALGGGDSERLANGELAYTGLVRGHPAAGLSQAPIRGRWAALVTENFASMADVHRVLGNLPEDADLAPTADGRPKTVDASIARLARLAGLDAGDASPQQWRSFAAFLARAQMRLIEDQIALLQSRGAVVEDAPIIGAGVGRAVVAELARTQRRSFRDFADFLNAAPAAARIAADCAPAAAVALLLA
jgi:probable H4MPT-linked C1 transfer pathway protein